MSRNVTFASDVIPKAAALAAGGNNNPQQQEALSDKTAPAAAAAANNNHNPSTISSSLFCPNCGSREIEQPHDASGASVCTDCGVVVEENAIVSAVEFVEGQGGASSMVGRFVSATSSKAYTGTGGGGASMGGGGGGAHGGGAARGGRYGFSRDSRETTLANGRRRIQEVASRLRLGSHFVDAAHRLFTIAVEKNFVQGRRTTHVVAACLYIACRQERSQHMLIDFSDSLQVNVFVLGTCFLKFRRLLGLKLEIIDPALYVYRFASHLGLDDKANAVALTALRLVARMKRDWIVAGRRPAGICAAALLIAARAHGFSKHHSDVTRILRVCGWTVTSRMREFEQTQSAQLTLSEFNTDNKNDDTNGQTSLTAEAAAAAAKSVAEQEADPPVFQRNRIREARAQAIQEGNVELLASGALDDPAGGRKATRWREIAPEGSKINEKKVQLKQLYESIEQELETTMGKKNDNSKEQSESGLGQLVTVQDKNVPDAWKQAYPKTKYGKALVLPNHATAEERQPPSVPVECKLNLAEWKEKMPESIDKEVESFFRTEEEEKQKEMIFNKLNKDYIEQQERKESERLSAEAVSNDQEKELAAQAEGHARYTKTIRNKKRSRDSNSSSKNGQDETTTTAATAATNVDAQQAHNGEDHMDNDDHEEEEEDGDDAAMMPSTEEQLMAAVNSRKISRKINYDALSSIFDEGGSFATDVMIAEDEHEDGGDDDDDHNKKADEDSSAEDLMFEML